MFWNKQSLARSWDGFPSSFLIVREGRDMKWNGFASILLQYFEIIPFNLKGKQVVGERERVLEFIIILSSYQWFVESFDSRCDLCSAFAFGVNCNICGNIVNIDGIQLSLGSRHLNLISHKHTHTHLQYNWSHLNFCGFP